MTDFGDKCNQPYSGYSDEMAGNGEAYGTISIVYGNIAVLFTTSTRLLGESFRGCNSLTIDGLKGIALDDGYL